MPPSNELHQQRHLGIPGRPVEVKRYKQDQRLESRGSLRPTATLSEDGGEPAGRLKNGLEPEEFAAARSEALWQLALGAGFIRWRSFARLRGAPGTRSPPGRRPRPFRLRGT